MSEWEKDVLNREVDSVITYDEFIDRYIENKHNERNCSNFTKDGFYFYECGAWGLGDLRIGFKTKEDLKKYREWRLKKYGHIKAGEPKHIT